MDILCKVTEHIVCYIILSACQCQQRLTENGTWIIIHTHCVTWDVIAHTCPKFNVEIKAWMSNSVPLLRPFLEQNWYDCWPNVGPIWACWQSDGEITVTALVQPVRLSGIVKCLSRIYRNFDGGFWHCVHRVKNFAWRQFRSINSWADYTFKRTL